MARLGRQGKMFMGVAFTLRVVALACAAVTLAAPGAEADQSSAARIDAARLQDTLERLSRIGRPAGGDFSSGVSRFAYSDADIEGRAYVMTLLKAAGTEPSIDAAGNIHALREGAVAGLKPIVIGSHIDSVPAGGNFDGALGALGAVEVLRTLSDHHVRLRHPLEVVIWSNEEGGTVGSGLAAGTLSPSVLDGTLNGIRRREGLARIGGDPDRIASARLTRGYDAGYVELHIEQSGRLEKAGKTIGVVDGIVAIDEYQADIQGVPNHAGATPMPERRNALLAAAKLIEAVQEEVTRLPGAQVGTVGHLEVFPNVRNIVPGRVTHSIELRDLDAGKIKAIASRITARAEAIAHETGTRITIQPLEHDAAAFADPGIQKDIEGAAASLGLGVMHLPSGAGHDAASMSAVGPMGMIFVPSVGGVSHSPKELTSWVDCAAGAAVLLETVRRFDQR